MKDKLQRQRFEHKYIVDEHVALAIRDFVGSYLTLDDYGATLPDNSYSVHTLYLDSPDLTLYKNTINGDKNRFKLRIRFYEDNGPVFFEIKRRINNIILKKRAVVDREAAKWILAGQIPEMSFLIRPNSREYEAVYSFSVLLNRLRAIPQVHVSYKREAWMAEGSNSIRVTMDRIVKTERRQQLWLNKEMFRPISVFRNKVVLELKFTDRFPNWFKDLVQIFGLRQDSAAKYVDGIINMGDRGLINIYI